MRRLLALLLVGSALLACGDDDTTAEPAASTTDATTESTTLSTMAPIGDLGDEPEIETVSGPSGSGCTPGEGDLPDGWWYGTLADDGTLRFDLACFFAGDAAIEAAVADGESADAVNNDYWVRNENAAQRPLTLTPDTEVLCAPTAGTLEPCAPADLGAQFAVWVRIQDGRVTKLFEQWVP